jgi:hypothetical protein
MGRAQHSAVVAMTNKISYFDLLQYFSREHGMNHSKYVLFVALIFCTFGVPGGSPLRAAGSGWDKLRRLRPGQQIHVHMRNEEVHKGEFQSVNAEGITLQQATGERMLARKDIVSVWAKGKNHLLRNMIIGGAIGACFFALPVHLANNRNGWWQSSAWAWWVFTGGGAGMGAAAGNTGWREVYRGR